MILNSICPAGIVTVFALPLLLIARGHAEERVPPPSAPPESSGFIEPAIPKSVQGTLRQFNETLSKDLKPDDNAAVILVQIFGDAVFEPALHDASLAMMGISSLAGSGPQFHYFEPYARRFAPEGEDPREFALQLNADMHSSLERVWTQDEFPALARYLEENAGALDAVVNASKKPRYYAPLLSADRPPRLLSASFLVEHRLPFIARCLTSRGMGRFGTGDFEGAVQDLQACHRLAALLASGSPLDVSNAKAQIVDSIPFFAEKALLESGRLTGEQAGLLLHVLQQLPEIPTAEYAADRGERAIIHQEIEFLKADETSFEDYLEQELENKDAASGSSGPIRIDWDLAITRADEIQNQVVQALSMADRDSQSRRFQQLDEEQEAWRQKADADEDQLAQRFRKDPAAASRWIGEDMARSLRTNCWQRRFTDDRAFIRRHLIQVGLALQVCQRQRGEFPASLDELPTDLLAKLPIDPYSQRPFSYVRENPQRARLTSWGANQVDDAGKTYNDDVILQLR
jgi:hypothetical protein